MNRSSGMRTSKWKLNEYQLKFRLGFEFHLHFMPHGIDYFGYINKVKTKEAKIHSNWVELTGYL